ncbi:MAG: M3 family metallopeptidase [Candidatus Baltobacteraceae bacterium]
MSAILTRLLSGLALAAFFCLPAGAAPSQENWNLTPQQIAANCTAAIATADTSIKAMLLRRSARTFESVVLPLEDATADLNDKTVAEQFLFNVATDKRVRDASLDCNNKESDFFTVVTANPDLYTALESAKRSSTAANAYQKKLTDLWLKLLERSGAGLPVAKRAEFVKLSQNLTKLQNAFAENLGNDATAIGLTGAQTQGLPTDFVATLKKDAAGTLVVPVNESTATFVLSNAKDPAARKSYYMAYNNREAGPNTKLLEEALATRDRLAHLLGYRSWAEYQLSDKMAATPLRVFSFLNGLDRAILPKAHEDIATLTALKARETGDPNALLNPWDIGYYDTQLNKTKYAVDQNAIRQYFPVQHTIDAVLGIYHKLLGVTFAHLTPANAWNPDVIEYTVSDTKTGKLIGTTYFDLFPRPGKYDHFANFGILPVRKTSSGYRPPIAAIVGNWPKPAPGHPALLSHDDVVTFFHEFGHDMAALLATAPYETLSAGFRADFVEAPSQMLENFVWQPSILKEISSNVSTGAPLPDDLIAKMVAAKYVDYAYFTTRQILYADFDMDAHTMGPHVDTTALWATVADKVSPTGMVVGTHPQAAFGHIMGGYDAGYYGYLWSKVYAQDMFTAFQKGGLENPAVGARYRKDILQPARTLEPDIEVRHFLGRPMRPDAFYQEFGIASPKQP